MKISAHLRFFLLENIEAMPRLFGTGGWRGTWIFQKVPLVVCASAYISIFDR